MILPHSPLAPSLFSLFWSSGSADTSREVCCVNTLVGASWRSSSQFPLPLQHWRKSARRVARFPPGHPRRISQFTRKSESRSHSRLKRLDVGPASWAVRESLALTGLSKMDPGVPASVNWRGVAELQGPFLRWLVAFTTGRAKQCKRSRQACTAGFSGEASAIALATTIDYQSAPGQCVEGEWPCSMQLRRRWLRSRSVEHQGSFTPHFLLSCV